MTGDLNPHPLPAGPLGLKRASPLYTFVSLLGEGSRAQVWSALEPAQGLPVAIKVFRSASLLPLVRREVAVAASLDHPSIVGVLDHGMVPPSTPHLPDLPSLAGSPYIAMELAEKGSLSRCCGSTSWSTGSLLLESVLLGLAHAHARNVLHRDLKPDNVVLDRWGRARITDFGLAHALGRQPDSEEVDLACGTPAFMAPEQLAGEWRAFGPWTDLYSFGCLAWTLFTGAPPFGHPSTLEEAADAHFYQEPPLPRWTTAVPEGLEALLRRLLHKDPGQRPRWAAQVLHDWSGLDPAPVHRTSPVAPPHSWPSPPPPDQPRPPSDPSLHGLRPVPLADRRVERERAWTSLLSTIGGSGLRFLLLRGTVGVGKSRLAEALCQEAHQAGMAHVFRGNHTPWHQRFAGVSGMVARFLRCHGVPEDELVDFISDSLHRQGIDDSRVRDEVLALVAPAAASRLTPVSLSNPQQRHRAVWSFLKAATRERGAVLWLDDVHWGEDSLDFALSGAGDPGLSPLPLLVVATARSDLLALPGLVGDRWRRLASFPSTVELELNPLSEEDRMELISGLLSLEPSLARQLAEGTGGNPLLAVHVVGDWVNRGLVERHGGNFHLPKGTEASLLDDLTHAWERRIEWVADHHSEGAMTSWEVAAALGSEIDPEEWERACQEIGEEPSWLLVEDALGLGLVRADPEGPQWGWSFAHPMLPEILERRARGGGRSRLHHRGCARALKRHSTFGTAERVARHLLAAGDRKEALSPLLQATGEALDSGYVDRARALLDERDGVLLQLDLPRRDEAWGQGWILRARLHTHLLDVEGWEEWALKTRDGARRHRWKVLECQAVGHLADVSLARWDFLVARRRYQSASRIAQKLGRRDLEVHMIMHLAALERNAGRYSRAEFLMRSVLEDPHAHSSPFATANTWTQLGRVLAEAGRCPEAERCYSRVEAALAPVLSYRPHGILLLDRAQAACIAENLETAEGRVREFLERWPLPGSGIHLHGVATLGWVLGMQGRHQEAFRLLASPLERAASLGRHHAFYTGLVCASLPTAAARGDWEGFDSLLDHLEHYHRVLKAVEPALAPLAGKAGELCLIRGETERGRRALALCAEHWTMNRRPQKAREARQRLRILEAGRVSAAPP